MHHFAIARAAADKNRFSSVKSKVDACRAAAWSSMRANASSKSRYWRNDVDGTQAVDDRPRRSRCVSFQRMGAAYCPRMAAMRRSELYAAGRPSCVIYVKSLPPHRKLINRKQTLLNSFLIDHFPEKPGLSFVRAVDFGLCATDIGASDGDISPDADNFCFCCLYFLPYQCRAVALNVAHP